MMSPSATVTAIYIYGSPMYISLSVSASACQALKGTCHLAIIPYLMQLTWKTFKIITAFIEGDYLIIKCTGPSNGTTAR